MSETGYIEERSIADARKEFADILNEAHYRGGVFKITKHDRAHAYIVGPEFIQSPEFVRIYVKKIVNDKTRENEDAGVPSSEELIEQVAQDLGMNSDEVGKMLDATATAQRSS